MSKKILISFLLIVAVALGGYFLLFDKKEEKVKTSSDGLSVVEDVKKLRIVSAEEPPTNYYSEDGKFTGLTVDIVEEIKGYLGLDVEIEVLPWARSYLISQKEPNVVIFTASKTQDRIDQGFHFVGPVTTRKYILWAREGSDFKIESIEDVKKQRLSVGAMRGDWREKYFKDLGVEVVDETNHRQSLERLLDESVDLWALSDMEAPLNVKAVGADMKDIEVAYVFRESPSYIMLSKDTSSEIIEAWQEAHSEIQKTDFFERASKKWSDELRSEVGYTEDSGFFIR